MKLVVALLALVLVVSVAAIADESAVVPEAKGYSVNLAQDSVLHFTTQYTVKGWLMDPAVAEWRLMLDGTVLRKGGFIRERQGVYLFDEDFRDLTLQNYVLLLTMDGRSETVAVRVINVGGGWEVFLDDQGGVSAWKVVGAGLLVFAFAATAIIFISRLVGGGHRGRR